MFSAICVSVRNSQSCRRRFGRCEPHLLDKKTGPATCGTRATSFIGEMWDLDALAGDCAQDGRYSFWLTAGPLPVTGAVGAPVNPLAVK